MTSPQRRKGKFGELEVANELAMLTGWPIRRRLRNGHHDEAGDLDGLPHTVAQVKNYTNLNAAVSVGLAGLRRQKVVGSARYAVLLIRRQGRVNGGRWVAVLDLEDMARLLVDAHEGRHGGPPV